MQSENTTAERAVILALNDTTLATIAAGILLIAAVLWSASGPNVEKTDFSLTYVGAHIIHHGLGSRLYDPEFQKNVRDSLFLHPNPLLFEHPPFEALLLSFLAAFSFPTAYFIWGLINAATWLTLMLFLRHYLVWPGEFLGYVCLWFLFAPLGVALFQGQPSLILLAMYALAFVELRKGRDYSAG